jgi:hypothetical protein
MAEQMLWLGKVQEGPWAALGQAIRAGAPVPDGFIVEPNTPESEVRTAYDELKLRQFTHFVAMRGPQNAALDVVGTDPVIYKLRAMRSEWPEAPILIQAMVNGNWCGQATWEGTNLVVRASEGLRNLDPDIYVFDTVTNECESRTIHPHPRKVFRAIDGRTRTMEVAGERQPLDIGSLKAIAEVAKNSPGGISWCLDDRGAWVISVLGNH